MGVYIYGCINVWMAFEMDDCGVLTEKISCLLYHIFFIPLHEGIL